MESNDMQSTPLGDGSQSFSEMIFRAATPKIDFKTKGQAVTKDGTPKWNVRVGVTHLDSGDDEYLTWSVPFGTDPNTVFSKGEEIVPTRLRVGASAKQTPGFTYWYSADTIAPADAAVTTSRASATASA